MIRSFVFSEGKLVGENLDCDALRLVRADKGLHIWIDLFQPTAEEAKTVLEQVFNFHPLAIEDCLAVSQLPKVEDYEEYIFMVFHAINSTPEGALDTAELNFFLGKEFLVTHHTVPLRSVDQTIERVQKNSVTVARAMDRLTHTLLDSLVDLYDPALTHLTAQIQDLEDVIFSQDSRKNIVGDLLDLKKQAAHLRQIVRPQKEVINRIAHGEFKMVRPTLLPYFRDISDNLRRIEESAQNFSDQLYLSLDVYLNKAANQTNEIIKVLTLLTAITTPTVLIGTWEGMNFHNMPELNHSWGYPVSIIMNAVSTLALVIWFRWRKWL